MARRRIDVRWGATEQLVVDWNPLSHGVVAFSPEIVRVVDRGTPRAWTFMGRIDINPAPPAVNLTVQPFVDLLVGVGSSNWAMRYPVRAHVLVGDTFWFCDGPAEFPAATISGRWGVSISGTAAAQKYTFSCVLGCAPVQPFSPEEMRGEVDK